MARLPSLSLATLLVIGSFVSAPLAWAQADTRALLERIERMERDMQVMQRMTARGATAPNTGTGSVVLTSPSAPSSGGDEVSGDIIAKLHLRLTSLEAQFRSLTGQIEEAGFKADAVNQRLDRMAADNDLRFKEIEQRLPGAPAAGAPSAPSAPQLAPTAGLQPPPAQSNTITLIPPGSAQQQQQGSSMGAPPRNLGQLTGSDMRQYGGNTAQAAPQPQQQAAVVPPRPATAKELYDQALALHRDGDHAGAERALRTFMASYSKDPLASSAQYWLADTYYQRKEYEQAAILFAEGYKTYPKGNKAPDSLLKLAQSFSSLSKKREACIALAQLNAEFPNPAEPIKRAAAVEKGRNGCT